MTNRPAPPPRRLIFIIALAILVLACELVVVIAYAREGTLGTHLHWVLPAFLIAYALYLLWSSVTRLRAAGK